MNLLDCTWEEIEEYCARWIGIPVAGWRALKGVEMKIGPLGLMRPRTLKSGNVVRSGVNVAPVIETTRTLRSGAVARRYA